MVVKRRNYLRLAGIIAGIIAVCYLCYRYNTLDITKVLELGNDFHYNTISASALIGGFLFTGISILISALSNERIKRLWDNHYLDNLYHAAFIGMSANVITIIDALIILCINVSEKATRILIYIEIALLFTSIVFIIWCIIQLVSVIKRLKDS